MSNVKHKSGPDAPIGRGVPVVSAELAEFSKALAERFPNRLVQRFVLPRKVREARELFIREVDSDDTVEAAILADATMSSIEKGSFKLTLEAERRQLAKLAIVGLGLQRGGRVVYELANHDGIPLAFDPAWTEPAWTTLLRYYNEVNGVPQEELDEGTQGALTVGAFAPPMSVTPASADTGRSAGSSGGNTHG